LNPKLLATSQAAAGRYSCVRLIHETLGEMDERDAASYDHAWPLAAMGAALIESAGPNTSVLRLAAFCMGELGGGDRDRSRASAQRKRCGQVPGHD
jgi:hypothetical protein